MLNTLNSGTGWCSENLLTYDLTHSVLVNVST